MHVRKVVASSEGSKVRENLKRLVIDAENGLHATNEQGHCSSRETIYYTLQECTRKKNIACGRHTYSLMLSLGLDSDVFLSDHAIRMFASCNCLLEANKVFYTVSRPSVFTWNAIITAHIKAEHGEKAIELFCTMQQEATPDKVTYLCAIKACSLLGVVDYGRHVHDWIVRVGFIMDVVIGSALVNMFCKCGDLEDARKVFDELPDPNTVSWNAIICGYAEHGLWSTALECFDKMQEKGIKPDRVSMLHMLKACGGVGCVQIGRAVHGLVIASGCESDLYIGSSVVDMYTKCGNLDDARKVFNDLPCQDLISYCAMISGYAQHGQGLLALELFSQIQMCGLTPDVATFCSIIKACGSMGDIVKCWLVHDLIVRRSIAINVVVGSSIIDMYARCGRLHEAWSVFDTMAHKNFVSWGALVTGYVQHDEIGAARELLVKMEEEGVEPSKATLLCILKACGSKEALEHGRFIHAHIAKSEASLDMIIGSTLVDMYVKCGSFEEARQVFNDLPSRDSVSWGAMISGCAQYGHSLLALDLFHKMQQEGIEPSIVTFSCVSKACGDMKLVDMSRLIHSQVAESGHESNAVVGSACIDTYVKCRALVDARNVFECLPVKDVVSWGVMISGYAECGDSVPAFELFEKMLQEGIEPNTATILCLVRTCGTTGSIKQGRLLHNHCLSDGLPLDVVIGTMFVEMYASCGSLKEAHIVFDKMPHRNVVSWGTLISGYAWYGDFLQVECCLDEMWHQGVKPVDVIFTSILAACSHAGLLEEGCHYFRSMIDIYGIEPKAEHFNCIVDILGRKGSLQEAQDFLQMMPTPPDAIVCTSLLNASRVYGSVQLGIECFTEVFQLDASDASGYALMSALCKDSGMCKAVDHPEALKGS